MSPAPVEQGQLVDDEVAEPPAKRPKKKVRLLLDPRTELSDDELKVRSPNAERRYYCSQGHARPLGRTISSAKARLGMSSNASNMRRIAQKRLRI